MHHTCTIAHMNTHILVCVYAHMSYTSHTKIKKICTVEESMEAWLTLRGPRYQSSRRAGGTEKRVEPGWVSQSVAGAGCYFTVAQQLIGDGAWKCISLGVSSHIDQQGHVFFSRHTVKRLILPASWNPGSYSARFPASFPVTWSQMDSNG